MEVIYHLTIPNGNVSTLVSLEVEITEITSINSPHAESTFKCQKSAMSVHNNRLKSEVFALIHLQKKCGASSITYLIISHSY